MRNTDYIAALTDYLNSKGFDEKTTIIEPTKVDGLKVEFNLTQPRPLKTVGTPKTVGSGMLRIDFGSSSSGDVLQIHVDGAYRSLDDVNTLSHFVRYVTAKVLKFSGFESQLAIDRADPKINTSGKNTLATAKFLNDWMRWGVSETLTQFINNYLLKGNPVVEPLRELVAQGAVPRSLVNSTFDRNIFFGAVNQLEGYIRGTVNIERLQQDANSEIVAQYPKLLGSTTEVAPKSTTESNTEVDYESTDATSKAWIALGVVGTLAVVGFAVHKRRNRV